MIKLLYIIFISLIVTNCSTKKVEKHHGVPFLEKKQSSLVVNETNMNDIKKILGNPSTKSKFDNDIWIYIERKQTQSNFKNEKNKIILQEIYDFNFRQLELSIREVGYGDQSINKKMKDYINLFHSMVSEIHFWHDLTRSEKIEKISNFLSDFKEIDELLDYFEKFNEDLSKKTLNSYLKSVSNL